MRRSGGYTLIELLVVLAVLGILSGLAMPLAEMTVQREREGELKRALWEIRDAIDAYKHAVDAGHVVQPVGATGYPPDLQSLVAGVPDAKGGARLVFLRRIPRDPFASTELPPEKTWRLRNYLSEADRSQPGADVYDVTSTSAQTGLNGIPLKEW
jgi:general secretion pathway protein G